MSPDHHIWSYILEKDYLWETLYSTFHRDIPCVIIQCLKTLHQLTLHSLQTQKFYVAAMLVLLLLRSHKVKRDMTSSGTILVNFMKLRHFFRYILGTVDTRNDNEYEIFVAP
jgi:hypothetical protein